MNHCPNCNASFSCGVADESQHCTQSSTSVACWCMALPRLPSATLRDGMEKAESCLCPDCLRARQQALRASLSGD